MSADAAGYPPGLSLTSQESRHTSLKIDQLVLFDGGRRGRLRSPYDGTFDYFHGFCREWDFRFFVQSL
jgi:hypothetical protein